MYQYGPPRRCVSYRTELTACLVGVDLDKYGAAGTCYAGYHYDLNFLTIHGKSRFPGLAVWLQDGRRMPVSIPDGCLLIQAGKQIEWLTNGYIRGGMHEVGPRTCSLTSLCEYALCLFAAYISVVGQRMPLSSSVLEIPYCKLSGASTALGSECAGAGDT